MKKQKIEAEKIDQEISPKMPDGVEVETVADDEYSMEVVKDFKGVIDPFFIEHKDPNYAYRFIRDEQKNISLKTSNILFDRGGWQIVSKNHALKKLKIKPEFISQDGLVRRGDQILVFMPRKLYEEKEAIKQKRANEPIDAVRKRLKSGDPTVGGHGVPHESMKGIQTQEALKGNWKNEE